MAAGHELPYYKFGNRKVYNHQVVFFFGVFVLASFSAFKWIPNLLNDRKNSKTIPKLSPDVDYKAQYEATLKKGQNKASELKDEAGQWKENLKNAKDQATAQVHDVKEDAKSQAGDLKGQVKSQAEDFKGQVKSHADELKGQVKSQAGHLKDKAVELKDEVKDHLN